MENSIESLERKLVNMEILVSELIAKLAERDNGGDDIIGDLKDCSEWIKRSPSTIYKMTSKRRIPHFKNGKRLLFKKSDVFAWLEKDRQFTEIEFRSEVDENLQQHAKSPWRG
jgi:excisionase family DNA binding protein